jgi:hypothetical protein
MTKKTFAAKIYNLQINESIYINDYRFYRNDKYYVMQKSKIVNTYDKAKELINDWYFLAMTFEERI